jgi:hypothetical protein
MILQLKTRIAEEEEAVVTRQRVGKRLSTATNQHATMAEVLEAGSL